MKRLIVLLSVVMVWALPASAQPEIQSQWNGARVAFIGDSITDPAQIGWVNNTFWNNLKAILGIEPYVYGISGHNMADLIGQAKRLEDERGQEIDAIIVFLGTNDYNQGLPLGDWYNHDTKVTNSDGVERELAHRELVYCDSTFRGRVNTSLKYLKTHYPDKQIILLTPIHRGYAKFGQTNVQPPEEYANRAGFYIDEFVSAVKEAGSIWAMPVIDLNSICGLLPTMQEHIPYFRNPKTDHLHPNTPGHLRMAYSLAFQLLGYPARFPKFVALSFDDGPNQEFTPKMLDILEENGVKGSFFVIGKNVTRKTAPILRRMVAMGCDVMNHTYSHPDLTKLTEEEILREVERTDSVILKWAGVTPTMLRPPYTAFNEKVAASVPDKAFIAGTSVGDWRKDMPAEDKVNAFLEKARDGSVLLFHDTNETTIEAVRVLIPALKARGFEFVTVPELFQIRGWMPSSNEKRMYSNVY